MYQKIDIPSFEILNYNHEEIKTIIPIIKENIQLNISNYGTLLGNRMLVNLNLMNKTKDIPKNVEGRKSDILIRRAFVEIDTLYYSIPEEFSIEQLPQNVEINSEFGEYQAKIQSNDKVVEYIRIFKMNKGLYSRDVYKEFVEFFEKMNYADNIKLVLVKN